MAEDAGKVENHTLVLLREIREEIRERDEKLQAQIARVHVEMAENAERLQAGVASVQAGMANMHVDVLEAKASSKEVAVRLTLVEKRLSSMGERLDKIETHLGLADA